MTDQLYSKINNRKFESEDGEYVFKKNPMYVYTIIGRAEADNGDSLVFINPIRTLMTGKPSSFSVQAKNVKWVFESELSKIA